MVKQNKYTSTAVLKTMTLLNKTRRDLLLEHASVKHKNQKPHCQTPNTKGNSQSSPPPENRCAAPIRLLAPVDQSESIRGPTAIKSGPTDRKEAQNIILTWTFSNCKREKHPCGWSWKPVLCFLSLFQLVPIKELTVPLLRGASCGPNPVYAALLARGSFLGLAQEINSGYN